METLLNQFTGENIIGFFVDAFLILFAFLFLMYAIALANETRIASKTLQTRSSPLFTSISFLHIPVAIFLMLLSLLLLL